MTRRQITVAVDITLDESTSHEGIVRIVRSALGIGFARLAVDDVLTIDSATVISTQDEPS